MSQNISHKLKILALHGYTQSADKFREKTYPFQRKVKKYAEFVFVTAPHRAPNDFVDKDAQQTSVELAGEPNDDTDSYAWYLRQLGENKMGYIYRGLQDTIDYLEDIFKEKGPFDGVFGFSQGGCVVGLLCDVQQRKLANHIKFGFAIMASSFKYEDRDFYKEKLTIPSLHIYGENDKQISNEMSQNLVECFANPVIAKHSGGHYIPGNTSLKKEYEMFFNEQWTKKFG